MKHRWIKLCQKLSAQPADFYAAARKIIRDESVRFEDWQPDLTLEEIGYTKNKLNRLIKDYIHEASRNKAVELWSHFVKRGSYSSACFHTHNHLVKSGATSPSESVETRGPCLQSVILTLIPGNRKTPQYCEIDVFYRTTEFYKKFPADLLLVDELLKPFDFSKAPIKGRTFHFANVTCHPMYIVVPATLATDPVQFFEEIRKKDPVFYKNCINWTHKYLVSSRGIMKYEQAKAVQRKAMAALQKNGNLKSLTQYIDNAYNKINK